VTPLVCDPKFRLPDKAYRGCLLDLAGIASGGCARSGSVQLKWEHQFQFAGYYAALEQGFYRAAGLDVIIREGGPNIDGAFQSGRQDRVDRGGPQGCLIKEAGNGQMLVSGLLHYRLEERLAVCWPQLLRLQRAGHFYRVKTLLRPVADLLRSHSSQSPDTSIPMDWPLELACY
jgi:NMT1/THI5 like